MHNNGFTLLELLFVMAIVMALASIAVPQYNAYRARAYDGRALADLRNVAIAEEAYYLDHEQYLSCDESNCAMLPGIARVSAGVELSIIASEDAFTGTSQHQRGSGREFLWDSDEGGLIER